MKKVSKPLGEGKLLLSAFIGRIFVVPRQWYPDERPVFKRPFPDVLFEMFKAWYTQVDHKNSAKYIDKLYPDLEMFSRDFKEIITSGYELGCEKKMSRGAYAMNRYEYRYDLSKCRFSKLGLTLYASVIQGDDSISSLSGESP